MDTLRAMLLWCAGAVEHDRFDALATERTRYLSLGLCMLVPAGLAAAGGTFAMGLLTDSWWLRTAAGGAWAAVVFAIDRALVVSLRRAPTLPAETRLPHAEGTPRRAAWRSASLVAARLALALVAGLVVAHALVLRLFAPEIGEQLDRELVAVRAERLVGVDARLGELEAAERERALALEALRRERRGLELERVKEGAGVGLTGRTGQGPVWTDLQRAIDTLDRDLAAAEAAASDARAAAARETLRLRAERAGEAQRLGDRQARGYMAYARALAAVAAASPELRAARRVLFVFLVMLELVPLLVKLLIGRGPYAAQVAADEWRSAETARVAVEADARSRAKRVRRRILELPWMRSAADRGPV